ncbi:hypothetical protein ABPG75_002454 [Micractinium tetrahymenae]
MRCTNIVCARATPQLTVRRPTDFRESVLRRLNSEMQHVRGRAVFHELLEANVRYLRGELQRDVCGRWAPLPPLLQGRELELVEELNGEEQRIFTFSPEPGLRVAELCDDGVRVGDDYQCGPVYREVEQRAYIDLLVEDRRLPALLEHLQDHPTLRYIAEELASPEDLAHTCHDLPQGHGGLFLDPAGRPFIALARHRVAITRAELPRSPWVPLSSARLHPGFAGREMLDCADWPTFESTPVMEALRGTALVTVMAAHFGPPLPGQPSLLERLEVLLGS